MKEDPFVSNIMNHFGAFESKLRENSKGLQLVSTYFSKILNTFNVFQESLSQSLHPLEEFIVLAKAENNSLSYELSTIIGDMKEFNDFIKSTCKLLKVQVTDPFELFISEYEKFNEDTLKGTNAIVKEIEAHKEKVIELKFNYSQHEKILSNNSKEETKLSEEAKEKYKEAINEHNELLKKHIENYKPKIKELKHNEINKVNSITKSFNNFFILIETIATKYKSLNQKIIDSLNQVNVNKDIELYTSILSRTYKHYTFTPMRFENHGKMYQLINEILYSKPNNIKKVKSKPKLSIQKEKVIQLCNELLEGKDIEKELLKEVFESFDHIVARETISKLLSGITDKYFVRSHSAFESLGQIVNYLLTMMSYYGDSNSEHLCGIFDCGFLLFSKKDKEVIYLRSLIATNSIWSKTDIWIRIIQHRISRTLFQANLTPVSSDQEKETPEKAKENVKRKSIIYNELFAVASQISLMQIKRQMGIEILKQFADYYGLPDNKVCDLLLDFEGAHILIRDTNLLHSEKNNIASQRVMRSLNKYEGKKVLVIIAKSLGYIGDLLTLRNVLVLNKTIFKSLKRRIYKKALEITGISMEVRKELWRISILNPKFCEVYRQIKADKLPSFLKSKSPTLDLINVDVFRSFNKYNKQTQNVTYIIILGNKEHTLLLCTL